MMEPKSAGGGKAVTFANMEGGRESAVSNGATLNGTLASSDSTSTEPLSNGSAQTNGLSSSSSLMDEKQHIQILCDTMKKQIISRAFYGWLAYCRHLKTVRTHLTDLVNQAIVRPDAPADATGGITAARWTQIRNSSGQITIEPAEFYRLVYFGGIEPTIRAEVWPYLLEHYRFEDTQETKVNHDREMRQYYEMIMSEWLAVEAIVRQRDKEIVAANLAKLSSESNNSTSEMPFSLEKSLEKSMLRKGVKSQSNEVFEDIDDFSITDSRKSSVQSVQNEKGVEETADGGAEVANQEASNCNSEQKATSTSGKAAAAQGNMHGPLRKLMRHRQVESVASLSGQTSSSGSGSMQNIFVTNPSIDQQSQSQTAANSSELQQELLQRQLECLSGLQVGELDTSHLPIDTGSSCVSPASSNGGIYSVSQYCQY